MTTTEILVIGCGPAGAAAGISALKSGRDVMVVEARKHPRLKLCAGLLTQKTHRALRHLLGDDGYDECMAVAVMSREPYFALWDGLKSAGRFPVKNKITLIDRVLFDDFLSKYYVRKGGKLVENDALVDIDFNERIATLQSGERIAYKRLIAADGANSRVRRLREKFEGRTLLNTNRNVLCVEVNVDAQDLDVPDVNVILNVVPRSYAWSFAKGSKVCLGMVKFRGEKFDVNQTMRQFMVDLGVCNVDKYQVKGAMLPFGNHMKRAARDESIFFVGDAAGFVEPLTGEGIYYALQSGIDAGESPTAAEYTRRLKEVCRLINASRFYQRMMEIKLARKLLLHYCGTHVEFMTLFYDKHIDNGLSDSFLKMADEYKRSQWRRS